MSLFLFLKFFHVLLFAFWLGTDMGTYYSSRYVINPNLTSGQRSTALKILLGCDMGPKIAMTLIMPTGLHMGVFMGIVDISPTTMIIIWVASFIWLSLVLAIYFGKNEARKKTLQKVDFWIRPIIVLFVAAIAIYAFIDPTYIRTPFISWKLLVVCGLILCGLGIRYHLGKFKPAFVDLMLGKENKNTNHIIKKSMDNCLPYVYGIWIGVSLNAAIGVHLINF